MTVYVIEAFDNTKNTFVFWRLAETFDKAKEMIFDEKKVIEDAYVIPPTTMKQIKNGIYDHFIVEHNYVDNYGNPFVAQHFRCEFRIHGRVL